MDTCLGCTKTITCVNICLYVYVKTKNFTLSMIVIFKFCSVVQFKYKNLCICTFACFTVEIIMVSWTFEDQLACLSDQIMFASDIKDWSKDIGRCISHFIYTCHLQCLCIL